MKQQYQVIIVGAGLSGLYCAVNLKRLNIPFVLLEAAGAVGGRIRTDEVDGFLLDRGFQVLLTDYPEARKALDFEKLHLRRFFSGALIRKNNKFYKVMDPCQYPIDILNTLMAPIGSLADKIKIAQLKLSLALTPIEKLLSAPEISTLAALKAYGFSDEIIDSFFKPFFGGVFLDRELKNSSRLFNWLFRSFSSGFAAVPKLGMEEIPKQLADSIGADNIQLSCRVVAVRGNSVVLESGGKLSASHIVLATNKSSTNRLLCDIPAKGFDRSVTCLYFSANRKPFSEPLLVLNGDNNGPINNLSVMSNVSSHYAPPDKALISISVVDDFWQASETLEQAVRAQMVDWFSVESQNWQHIRSYKILDALPVQSPPTNFLENQYISPSGHFLCGDYTNTASINGALISGRRVAELISESISADRGNSLS